jgi:hypothetical protein
MIRAVEVLPGALLWICGEMRPKFALFSAPVGGPNMTLFVRLKASARNWIVLRSRILKFRENARSMFITFGPETVSGRVGA